MRQKDITLNICWTKTCSFQSQHTTQPAVFRDTTVYRGKHVVSRHFRRSHLKANKVSKSESTRKLNKHYHFWKCADALMKIVKIGRCLSKLQLAKFDAFFETQCILLFWYIQLLLQMQMHYQCICWHQVEHVSIHCRHHAQLQVQPHSVVLALKYNDMASLIFPRVPNAFTLSSFDYSPLKWKCSVPASEMTSFFRHRVS